MTPARRHEGRSASIPGGRSLDHAARIMDFLTLVMTVLPCSACALIGRRSSGWGVEGARGEGAPALDFHLAAWTPDDAQRITPPWAPDSAEPWWAVPVQSLGGVMGWLAFSPEARPVASPSLPELQRLASGLLYQGVDEDLVSMQLTRLSILMTIGQALSGKLELEPLLGTVYREVGRLFDTTNFYIALCRSGAPEWAWTFHIERGVRETPTRHPREAGLTGYIIRTGKPLFLTVFSKNQDFLIQENISVIGEIPRSWMGVPLIAGESVVGVMAIQSYEREGIYNQEDLDLFAAIAAQIAVAVRNAQLFEDLGRRARETEALVAIGRDITSSLDLETVLGRVASSARNLLNGDSLAIFLGDEAGQAYKAVAVSGLMAAPIRAATVYRGRGILGAVIQSGLSEINNTVETDPRAVHIEGTEDAEGEKLMAAPLTMEDQVIGVIAVWRKGDTPPFDAEELQFLEGIGRQASVAIRNATLFGQAKAAQVEAEHANRAKSSFLASMSHELRTPLNAILLYSELLMDEIQDRGLGELSDDLDKIQNAGKHLLGLIDDILDLSKIEAGRMTVFLEDFSIPALLSEIVVTVQPLVDRNRNRFLLEADPSIQMIHSDQKKLRQIIFNLLSNACKFTTEGVIRLKVEPDTKGRIRFSVSDTGIGLSQDQIIRIFHEFTQAEDETSRKYGGTGLGLTLCRKFAELLAGEIRVESVPGAGSTFMVVVPGLPVRRGRETGRGEGSRPGDQGKVLVIEDDLLLREAMTRMLTREGFEVTVAGNGLEGLQQARTVLPHVITLDIAMPGMDGWQVLTQLKADSELKNIPVVIITVLDDRAKGISLEASDYLQKPVERDQLMATLAKLLPKGDPTPILIVEDDEAAREGLRRILECEGLRTLSAGDGREALALLDHHAPGLILLDLMMPEMDGFQLMEELQRHPRWGGIPVVVITAAELTPRQRERLQKPQIRQILRKGSYSRRELITVVRKCVQQTLDGRGSSHGVP